MIKEEDLEVGDFVYVKNSSKANDNVPCKITAKLNGKVTVKLVDGSVNLPFEEVEPVEIDGGKLLTLFDCVPVAGYPDQINFTGMLYDTKTGECITSKGTVKQKPMYLHELQNIYRKEVGKEFK